MSARRPRTAWLAGLLFTAATASTLTAAPAHAIVGQPVNDSFAFTAKLDIGAEGNKHGCSAALVAPQWLVTAASCFVDDPAQGLKVPAGPLAPSLKTTATIGRSDLTRETGSVVDVVELAPRDDRDLVLAKLAKPVAGVSPVNISPNAPISGQDLWASGYGRTKDEWAPDRLHYAKFAVGAVDKTTIGLAPKTEGTAICQGDTGGPTFRDVGGRFELAGVNSRSWQGGCLGTDEKETRTTAIDTRVDDIASWIQTTTAPRDLLKGKKWTEAKHLVPGYFTGGAPGGSRHMDLFVTWADGSASIFQGADNNDPKYPFTAEHKISGSGWKGAKTVSGGNFTGSGSDGLMVSWESGEVTWFSHVDQNGFSKEEQLRPANATWKDYATLTTVGRYTANALRDDVLVVWKDGSISLFPDLGTNKLMGEIQLQKALPAGTYITQVSAGEFTGKATSDLLVRWQNGSASIFPGVTPSAKPFHDEIQFRLADSAWKNTLSVTAGAFAANNRPGDVLVRWSDGNLGLYPAVDAAGTHGEVDLLK
ncbi:trypsin-like serine protease [Streptomyces sp. ISL-11]|uniref:S1 family peptidase n=1 Tax=Streptomyces sp. ISL-11 TaxID=2819174 RepID=UPI001BE553F8|nr:S1 family peptidase [Streptomyces sp. ISL-11]MBT2382298.1 S1 family peptidase [Streptomyces sp. ISL-11]